MLNARIQGIPCLIEVTFFLSVPPWRGSAHTCPSSDDYYGYTDIEFDVYDRKGYKAPWLERKMTEEDVNCIERLIIKQSIIESERDHGLD